MKQLLIAAILVLSLSGPVVFAQQQNTVTGSQNTVTPAQNTVTNNGGSPEFTPIRNPLRADSLEELVNALVDIALQIGVIVATLALIWVGFLFIIAIGNPSKIEDARQALKWVVIGIVVLFSAKIVIEIIRGTLSQFMRP